MEVAHIDVVAVGVAAAAVEVEGNAVFGLVEGNNFVGSHRAAAHSVVVLCNVLVFGSSCCLQVVASFTLIRWRS